MCHKPIRLEDVHKTSAVKLLQLSHQQLDRLIGQAEYTCERAQNTLYWLQGIKLEKTIREDMPMQESKGGEHE